MGGILEPAHEPCGPQDVEGKSRGIQQASCGAFSEQEKWEKTSELWQRWVHFLVCNLLKKHMGPMLETNYLRNMRAICMHSTCKTILVWFSHLLFSLFMLISMVQYAVLCIYIANQERWPWSICLSTVPTFLWTSCSAAPFRVHVWPRHLVYPKAIILLINQVQKNGLIFLIEVR